MKPVIVARAPAKLLRMRVLPAVFTVVAGGLLAGCGSGSGLSGNVVAKVGNMSITKAMFDKALANSLHSGAEEGSKPVIPDPPNYTACVAGLEATEPKPYKGTPGPTKAELKASCETRYQNARSSAISSLITQDRTLIEAEEQGVHVSQAAVEAAAKKTGGFVYVGLTLADKMRTAKTEMLRELMRQKTLAQAEAKVTEAEVNVIFDKNRQAYHEEEHRTLLDILTKTKAAAERAKREIQSGKSFASVARKVSIAGSAKEGGTLSLTAKCFPPQLRSLLGGECEWWVVGGLLVEAVE